MDISRLTSEQKVKIVDTVKYSLSNDPSQNKHDVIDRCKIAIPAEFYVADWVDGYVNFQEVNHDNNDPYEWAWDVLAHPRFSGLRIEVKTYFVHDRSNHSPWINVTTGYDGPYPNGSGINLGPMVKHAIADCIIILTAERISQDVIEYTNVFAGDVDDLLNKVKKSKTGAGGYIMQKF